MLRALLRRRAVLAGLAAVVLVGFVGVVATYSRATIVPLVSAPNPFPDAGPWVDSTMAGLSLEEKVAQLFMARAYGHFENAESEDALALVQLVEDFGIGGFAFFQGEPLEQLALVNDLQRRSEVPLLIGQDMEWGAGMRVAGATSFPRPMAIGATRDPLLARAVGYATGREARALGTHQIYAPVADVNVDPSNPIINTRSFGEDPQLVAEMVTAFIEGAQQGGVLATAKHFPGHGDTSTDSHLGLPVLPFARERLAAVELVPFAAAIEAGVASVMVGHLALPELEPEEGVPASLSPVVTQQLLRDEMGFRGLVVTDALDMRSVTERFGTGEAAVRALEAGADVILISEEPYAARRAVLEALGSGRLTEARVDEALRRVLRAKAHVGLDSLRTVDVAVPRAAVAMASNEALSQGIARRALTLLRDEEERLPLPYDSLHVAAFVFSDATTGRAGAELLRELRQRAGSVDAHVLDARSNEQDYAEALDAAAEADLVLVASFSNVRAWSGTVGLPPEQRAAFDTLVQADVPVALLALGNPYLTAGLSAQPDVFLAAYSGGEETQRAVVHALYGEAGIAGELPVSLPQHDFGDGLVRPQTQPRVGYPEGVGMRSAALAALDPYLRSAVEARAFPGAALAVGRAEVIAKLDGYGHYTYDAQRPVEAGSVFDVASLTKVVATTTAAMLLYERGALDLDAPVARYVPAFAQSGKKEVTIRHLLTHTSGLPAFRPFHQQGFKTRRSVLDAVLAAPLGFKPGTDTRYSDFGMITLMRVVEAITERPFAAFTREEIFEPLGMHQTGFRPANVQDSTRDDLGIAPPAIPDAALVPTEREQGFRDRLLQGEVHDETAWLLGGVSGHAGLFSTAPDLARFAYMLVHEGRIGGRQFLQPETIDLFTRREEGRLRGLGWDLKSLEGYTSSGAQWSDTSFGHTGYTGTSLWIDPEQELFVVLLTNRVYPDRSSRAIGQVRPDVADLAYAALAGAPTLLVPLPDGGEGE